MALKKPRPTTAGRRHRIDIDRRGLSQKGPEKSLSKGLKRTPGRSGGRVTVRHKQVGAKKLYRQIDFKRDKKDIPARVTGIEYDPYRSANIALLVYADGERRYILAPQDLKVDQEVLASEKAEIKVGNSLPLKNIPLGTFIHNVEIYPGKGAQLVRGAGASATVSAQESGMALVKLPSGEIHRLREDCWATVGAVGNEDWKSVILGKAGRKRRLGVRPTVRGVVMHPNAHPHGGGEGKSGIGMPSPKSPWGKPTLGKKTRRRSHTDKYIVSARKRGRRS